MSLSKHDLLQLTFIVNLYIETRENGSKITHTRCKDSKQKIWPFILLYDLTHKKRSQRPVQLYILKLQYKPVEIICWNWIVIFFSRFFYCYIFFPE